MISSIVYAVIVTSMHDCIGCLAVVLGQQGVPFSLFHDWGWSTTRVVSFVLAMTPQWIGLSSKNEHFVSHDSTSPRESNLSNMSTDHKSDVTRKNSCGLHTHMWLPPSTYPLSRTWQNSSCHHTKIDEYNLGTTWGTRSSREIAVILVQLIPKGGHI